MMATIQWLQQHSIIMMFAVFVMILVTTFWPGRKQDFDKAAHIPLDDDR
jgi:cbb3-type cytochrome oxidase subunit 3